MLEVKPSPIEGEGVFTSTAIKKNKNLFWMFEKITLAINDVAYPRDLKLSDLCWKVNHQKNPNCKIRTNDGFLWYLNSCKKIEKNEELTLDYTTLPYFMQRDIEGYKEL